MIKNYNHLEKKSHQEVTVSVAVIQMVISSVISFHYALQIKTHTVNQVFQTDPYCERLLTKIGAVSWKSS